MLDRLIERWPYAGPIYHLGLRQWARAIAYALEPILGPPLELLRRGDSATI